MALLLAVSSPAFAQQTHVVGQGHTLGKIAKRYNTTVSYTHLRAHETPEHLVCRLLLEKKKKKETKQMKKKKQMSTKYNNS